METLLERFLRYISFDTQSDPDSSSQPSTDGQFVFLNMLKNELSEMGVEASIDQWGYVMAGIPANCRTKAPSIGFIAHVDTSPDACGKDIRPQIIENYDGGDIELGKSGIKISVCDFPELTTYKGQTIITTDGTTLLGADDKAGVAEIMDAVQYIMSHPEFKHGTIKIGFTPDEEIGRGVIKFDVEKFGADYAYTMDGGCIGELEYENFNAASAKIHISGRNIHPGYAKDKMINASLIGMEFNALLPARERPEHTCGYEGFYHLTDIHGCVEEAELEYIIRDHDMDLFRQRVMTMKDCAERINRKYGKNTATVEITEQYHNMKEKVEPHFHIIEKAIKAMEMEDIRPIVQPIRGGTDGANLSFMGLPCPNIFAGGHNFHGKLEYIPLESMLKATKVIINLISQYV